MPEEKPGEDAPATGEQPEPTETTTPITSIDKANEVLEKLQAQNDRTEKLVERQEALRAEEILGGKADAGAPPPPPKEETDKEYIAKVLRGDFNEDKSQ